MSNKNYPDPPVKLHPQHIARTCGKLHFIFRASKYDPSFSIIQETTEEFPNGAYTEVLRKVELKEKHIDTLKSFIQQYECMMYDINVRNEELEAFYEEHPDHPQRPDDLPF